MYNESTKISLLFLLIIVGIEIFRRTFGIDLDKLFEGIGLFFFFAAVVGVFIYLRHRNKHDPIKSFVIRNIKTLGEEETLAQLKIQGYAEDRIRLEIRNYKNVNFDLISFLKVPINLKKVLLLLGLLLLFGSPHSYIASTYPTLAANAFYDLGLIGLGFLITLFGWRNTPFK